MSVRNKLGRRALRAAIRARLQAGVADDLPLCIFDFAERHHGVEVWFVDIPSLEGMYQKGSPGRLLISSHRTPGRQAMTCAHELGHHVFGHGTQVDEYVEDARLSHNLAPEELVVRLFASFLLMPAPAVHRIFKLLGSDVGALDAGEVLAASHYLGASYEGLIQHMRWSLNLIDEVAASRLLKASRKSIVTNILGEVPPAELVIAGTHWTGRAIDLSVGDLCLLPAGLQVGDDAIELSRSLPDGDLYVARRQGTTRVEHPGLGWASYVRVSQSRFSGRNVYRHMEAPDECR